MHETPFNNLCIESCKSTREQQNITTIHQWPSPPEEHFPSCTAWPSCVELTDLHGLTTCVELRFGLTQVPESILTAPDCHAQSASQKFSVINLLSKVREVKSCHWLHFCFFPSKPSPNQKSPSCALQAVDSCHLSQDWLCFLPLLPATVSFLMIVLVCWGVFLSHRRHWCRIFWHFPALKIDHNRSGRLKPLFPLLSPTYCRQLISWSTAVPVTWSYLHKLTCSM